MDAMTEIIMIVGSKMPEQFMFDEVVKQIEVYKLTKDDKVRERIYALCMMIISGCAAREYEGGAAQLIKEMREEQQMMNMVKPDRPKN